MRFYFGLPDYTQLNNKIDRVNTSLWSVPLITIYNYFKVYENIYFLSLSIFQLLTLGIFPKEWSPTGAFSTAIPLTICITMEILLAINKYNTDYKRDQEENNKFYCKINPNLESHQIVSQDIYPGHIISLSKNEIVPVDSILIETNTGSYGKISLALLNGESNIKYVSKPVPVHVDIDYYMNSTLHINGIPVTPLDKISGYIDVNNHAINICQDNFIPAGSIVKSDMMYVWTVACGVNRLYYGSKQMPSTKIKYSRIDDFVGYYMMNISVKLLLAIITATSLIKTITDYQLGLSNFLIYCIQSWILFNGIIPFSVKIFLILARNIQARYNCIAEIVTINNPLQIDDFGKITKLICDKTGTVTKNDLELSKIIVDREIIDISELHRWSYIDHFYQCLGLCIHYDETEYSSIEDKVMSDGYQLCGGYEKNNNEITLRLPHFIRTFKYNETNGINFTFERKMSSCVVMCKSGNYYIYSKGSIDAIHAKLDNKTKSLLRDRETIICTTHPELRLLALAYRRLDANEIGQLNVLHYHDILETNLQFLGIIGIKDTLQDNVKSTVTFLDSYDIKCNLCTGDRKVTAICVAKDIGMASNIVEYEYGETKPMWLSNSTLVFNNNHISNLDSDLTLKDCILACENFIGYNMSPDNKKAVTALLQSNNICTIAIGDGFNDIAMFDEANISISIKGHEYIENYTDYSISKFEDLTSLFKLSAELYQRNALLVNFTFYRCSFVAFAIFIHYILTQSNDKHAYVSPLDGFVLQAFNFAWLICPIAYVIVGNYIPLENNIAYYFNSARLLTMTCYRTTIRWNIAAVYGSFLIIVIYYYLDIVNSIHFNIILGLTTVSVLNIKVLSNTTISPITIAFSLIGMGLYCIYAWYILI